MQSAIAPYIFIIPIQSRISFGWPFRQIRPWRVLPKDGHIPFVPNADFVASYRTIGNTYQYARLERVAVILYQTQDYPALRDFFQKMNTQDQTQVVLKSTPASTPATAGACQN